MRRAPAFWQDAEHPLAALLGPVSWIWDYATRRRRVRTTGRRTPLPSICVGNVTAGGAGKTPTALRVAQILLAQGQRPAFGNRGYGAKLAEPVIAVDPSRHSADDVGDEALLLAATAPCYVSHDRLKAAQAALESGASHIIFDDGLQNPRLAYDCALLVIDGVYGLGNGRIIPAGPLRESLPDALSHSDAVIMIGDDKQQLGARCAGKPVLRGDLAPDLTGIDHAQPFLAFAGIGRPEKFFSTCRAAGLALAATQDFPDHHAYTVKELEALAARAAVLRVALLTTAKDAARLSPDWRARVIILPVTLQLEEPQRLLQLLPMTV